MDFKKLLKKKKKKKAKPIFFYRLDKIAQPDYLIQPNSLSTSLVGVELDFRVSWVVCWVRDFSTIGSGFVENIPWVGKIPPNENCD